MLDPCVVGRMRGFEIVEVNASDTRNKSDSKLKDGINGKLSNRIKELVTNSSIHLSTAAPRQQVLVMDEVDGMSGEFFGRQFQKPYYYCCCFRCISC